MFPFWSPDSRFVGFFADIKLKTVDAAGGIVNVLADAPASRGGTWSRDNVIVFSPRLTSPLFRMPASGGAVQPVTRLDEKQQEISHRWPSFLPDGKHLLYTSRGRGVYLSSVDGSEAPRRLLDDSTNAEYSSGMLLYGRGNTILARPFDTASLQLTGGAVPVAQGAEAEINSDRTCFSSSSTGLLAYHFGAGQSQLTWYDRRGTRMGTFGDAGLIRGVDIAPDDRTAAVVLADGAGAATIWIYELGSAKRHRFSSESAFNLSVAWSRDSTRLAVAAKRDTAPLVYTREVADPRNEEVLFRSPAEILMGAWLPDGTITLSTRNPKTGWDVSYLPSDHHGEAIPLLTGATDEVIANASPDGRWILYTSGEPGDMVLDAYAVAFPKAGRRYQVSTNGAHFARWLRSGNEIVYARGKVLVTAPVRSTGGKLEIGAPQPLFQLQADCQKSEISCFDVSADGKRFLVVDPTGAPAPVALVQNWTADLKK
jgi:Tol biopolymer transport system component